MNLLLNYASDFLSLFFPETCCACGQSLVKNESVVCTECRYDLPYTHFHLQPDNPVARLFLGRFPFKYAMACFYFYPQSKVQHLIHQLKYNNKPEAGFWIGEMYGNMVKDTLKEEAPDLIIPVPLHKKRRNVRGYNQSECIAAGLSAVLHIPVDTRSILRTTNTVSQTNKSRFSRYENMKDVFSVSRPDCLAGKHVLIVDDVVTTGATIEACALSLLAVEGVKVSLLAAAQAV